MLPVLVSLVLAPSLTLSKLQDLTWVMDPDHISYLPAFGVDPFQFKYNIGFVGNLPDGGPFVAYNYYSTIEHMGTHVDAPYHFSRTGRTMDHVPLEDLLGPLVVINICNRAMENPDATVSVQDLLEWEEKYGIIPDRAFIVMYSGWEEYFGDQMKYVGTMEPDGAMHFPGFGEDTAKWLVANRNILGLGVDTLSIDPGTTESKLSIYPVHQIILTQEKIGIENLKNVGKLPECGARLAVLPIMMRNGTGAQARVFAEWYPGAGYMTDCNGAVKNINSYFDTAAGNSVKVSLLMVLAACLMNIIQL
ncbi:hypothetical protein GJAV_G00051340 [Gymnothorax javanicus]|nr:hypothetical protein GJAV_G00051340 [Gymnothorax javanicus]